MSGRYILKVPADGEYSLQAQMAAFAVAKTVVQVTGTDRATPSRFELDFVVAIRTVARERKAGYFRAIDQSLSVASTEAEADATARGNDTIVPSGISIPGMTENSATESIAVSGNASAADSSFSSDELRTRMQEYRDQSPGFRGGEGGGSGRIVTMGGGGGRGRFDVNRVHGSVYYSIGDSALDASPYSLTGDPRLSRDTSRTGTAVRWGSAQYPKDLPRRRQKHLFYQLQRRSRQQSL